MKKLLLVVLFLAGVFFNRASAQLTINNNPLIKKLSDSTVIVSQKAIVPVKHIFYLHNSEGRLVGTFTGGQQISWPVAAKKTKGSFQKKAETIKTTEQNCFKTPCPSNAPSGSVCWDCK